MGIGRRLKEAREHAGLTQEELGKMIGITGSAITNYERDVSHPKEPIIYKLMNTLNIEPNFLFQDCVSTIGVSSHFQVSFAEQKHIKKYRFVDPYGQEAVDGVLDTEYRRCLDDAKSEAAALDEQPAPHPIVTSAPAPDQAEAEPDYRQMPFAAHGPVPEEYTPEQADAVERFQREVGRRKK